jgi:ribonuclease HII
MTRFEQRARKRGYKIIAGVDEAGRGSLAGPVVAAAVVFPDEYRNGDIRDSKQLSAGKREKLYQVIREGALAVGIGVSEPPVIDDKNVLRASLMAMEEAVANLFLPVDYLLVDGNQPVQTSIPQETIVKGDCRSISIAAASIIAKVSRDRIMEMYHRQYPQYNFIENKGYGTKEHREAIRRYGFCKIHRRTFRWVRDHAGPQVRIPFPEEDEM